MEYFLVINSVNHKKTTSTQFNPTKREIHNMPATQLITYESPYQLHCGRFPFVWSSALPTHDDTYNAPRLCVLIVLEKASEESQP